MYLFANNSNKLLRSNLFSTKTPTIFRNFSSISSTNIKVQENNNDNNEYINNNNKNNDNNNSNNNISNSNNSSNNKFHDIYKSNFYKNQRNPQYYNSQYFKQNQVLIQKIKSITNHDIIKKMSKTKKFKELLRYEVQRSAQLIIFITTKREKITNDMTHEQYIKLIYDNIAHIYFNLKINNYVTPDNTTFTIWLGNLESIIKDYNNKSKISQSPDNKTWINKCIKLAESIFFKRNHESKEVKATELKRISDFISAVQQLETLVEKKNSLQQQQNNSDNNDIEIINIDNSINEINKIIFSTPEYKFKRVNDPLIRMTTNDIKFCKKFILNYYTKEKELWKKQSVCEILEKAISESFARTMIQYRELLDNIEQLKNSNIHQYRDEPPKPTPEQLTDINFLQIKHLNSTNTEANQRINRFIDCEIGYSNASIQFLSKLVKAYPLESEYELRHFQHKVYLHLVNMYTKIRLQSFYRRSFNMSRDVLDSYLDLLKDITVQWNKLSQTNQMNVKTISYDIQKVASIASSINFREYGLTEQTKFLDILLQQVLDLHGHKQNLIIEKQNLINELQRELENPMGMDDPEDQKGLSLSIKKLSDELQSLRYEQHELSMLANIDFGMVRLSLSEIEMLISKAILFKTSLSDLLHQIDEKSEQYLLITHEIDNINASMNQFIELRDMESASIAAASTLSDEISSSI